MVEAMHLYSACSETSMSDGVKKDNLQKIENGLNEVARYIDRKIYEIETKMAVRNARIRHAGWR